MDDFGDHFKTKYDARLVEVELRFGAEMHGPPKRVNDSILTARSWYSGGWDVGYSQSNQTIPLGQGRLHVLLGRNGAGKSRLLASLRRCRVDDRGYPAASLMFELPSRESHDAWLAHVANVDDDFFGDEATPPIVGAVFGMLVDEGHVHYVEPLGWRGSELLEFFEATDAELERWGRLSDVAPSNAWFSGLDTPGGPTAWWPTGFADRYLMLGAKLLEWNHTNLGRSDENKFVLGGGRWFDDPGYRTLVLPAVRQFLGAVSHLEYVSDSIGVRLIAPDTNTGPLGEFLERKAAEKPEEDFGTWPFPVELFGRTVVGGYPRIASFTIPVPSMASERQNWFRLVEIDPSDDVDHKITGLVTELTSELVDFGVKRDENVVVIGLAGVVGVDAMITSVAESVRQCEVGINGLGLEWPDGRFGGPGRELPRLLPELRWQDAVSGDWFPIGHASEGQKQVIAIFLQLALLRGGSGLSLIVGDEFDRHLHPSASTAVLKQMRDQIETIPSACSIVSTHNVPALSRPSLLGVERIFAKRGPGGFEYTSSLDASEELVAEILGASFLDSLRLKRLFILVEGEHDELVIHHLLQRQLPGTDEVHVVNPRSPDGWTGTFANALRFMDAPVLVVYDKRHVELESEWDRVRKEAVKSRSQPRWGGELRRFLDDVTKRERERKGRRGDTELKTLLYFLRNSAYRREKGFYECDVRQASRISLCGLECDDIVDLLPITAFPKAGDLFSSWRDAHEHFERENPRGRGTEFKKTFGIHTAAVEAALDKTGDAIHSELARLYEVVVGLINRNSPTV